MKSNKGIVEKNDKETKPKAPKVARVASPQPIRLREKISFYWAVLLSLSRERFFILLLLCLFVGLANAPSLFIPTRTFKIGETLDYDLKARYDVLIEDQGATQLRRQEIAQGTPAVYDFDERAAYELQRRIRQGFQGLRELQKKSNGFRSIPEKEARLQLEKVWGIEVSPAEFASLIQNRFSESFESSLIQVVQSVMTTGVVNNKFLLMNEQGKAVTIRKLPSKQELQVRELERFPDLDDARDKIEQRSIYLLTGEKRPLRQTAVKLAQKMVVPNLNFNKAETEERRTKAIQEVRPVLFQIKRGEIILREGEKITEDNLSKVRLATQGRGSLDLLITSIGLALVCGLFLYTIHQNVVRTGKILEPGLRDLVFLAVMLAASFLSIRTADFVTQILVSGIPRINPTSVLLAIPIAVAPMLVSLALGPLPAILFALVQAFLVVLFLDGSPGLPVYFTIGGLWVSQCRKTCHNRWDLIRLGGYLGLINMASALALQTMEGKLVHLETPLNLLFAFLGGIIAGILVTGFSPLVEKVFGYTTDMILMERANLDQPLMRQLLLHAPGTYHHSVIVGNMVEAAAEAIGTNPLLSRVSAYYHDIGKVQKPLYFIENQMGTENKHEKLAPSMSSLILIAHVKDGVELARQYKLETPLIDVIRQHHGTGLISYFYQKAVELKGGDTSQVSTEDFRYPGPKPQSREAGLVLLADATEAASRTLIDPTPSRIQGLVQKIINNAFSDGQLDECDLTLKDLNLIAASFTKTLNAIFHHRVEYPENTPKPASQKKKPNGDPDQQPPGIIKPEPNSEPFPQGLKSA